LHKPAAHPSLVEYDILAGGAERVPRREGNLQRGSRQAGGIPPSQPRSTAHALSDACRQAVAASGK
jgi:hypothetical protein